VHDRVRVLSTSTNTNKQVRAGPAIERGLSFGGSRIVDSQALLEILHTFRRLLLEALV
jgi:hypothetical protein